jgi:hypothetical protein
MSLGVALLPFGGVLFVLLAAAVLAFFLHAPSSYVFFSSPRGSLHHPCWVVPDPGGLDH